MENRPSDYIKHGWCQLASAMTTHPQLPCDIQSPFVAAWCLNGAITLTKERGEISDDQAIEIKKWLVNWIRVKLGASLGASLGGDYSYYGSGLILGHWNDMKGRTQKEVVAVLQQAEEAVLGPRVEGA